MAPTVRCSTSKYRIGVRPWPRAGAAHKLEIQQQEGQHPYVAKIFDIIRKIFGKQKVEKRKS